MDRKKRWDELSVRTRRLIIVAATIEGVLKIAALIDLARRRADEVRGIEGKVGDRHCCRQLRRSPAPLLLRPGTPPFSPLGGP